MKTVKSAAEVRKLSRAWRQEGHRVAVVPTMGALHEGHLSLMDLARERAGRVIVTIFVNPTQFGPSEDLEKYPRDLEGDLALCAERGADLVFTPEVGAMYSGDHAAYVTVEGALTKGLCGAARPEHFRGVATIVSKLFHITEPDLAVFGRKDAQQLAVIRRMVRDLDFPVTIVPAPIVRESDGLAMSSRNANLSTAERREAPALYRALDAARELFLNGERDARRLRHEAANVLADAELLRVDYVELVDEGSFEPLETVNVPAILALAAFYERARLIDNILLDPQN